MGESPEPSATAFTWPGIALLLAVLAVVAVVVPATTGDRPPPAAAQPEPTPAITAPQPTLMIDLSRDKLVRGEAAVLRVVASNPSEVALRSAQLSLVRDHFVVEQVFPTPADVMRMKTAVYTFEIGDITPFGSATWVAVVSPDDGAEHTAYTLGVQMSYSWSPKDNPALSFNSTVAGKATISTLRTPESTAAAPAMPTITTTSSRGKLTRGQDVTVTVVAQNASDIPLKNVQLKVVLEDFELTQESTSGSTAKAAGPPPTPVIGVVPAAPDNKVATLDVGEIRGFGGTQWTFLLHPKLDAHFGEHHLTVLTSYSTTASGEKSDTQRVQSSDLTLTVTRQYEDELGSVIPEGAPLVYFLLPIIPAILAYRLTNRWFRGSKDSIFDLPLKGTLPAAFGALIANVIVQVAYHYFDWKGAGDYTDPQVLGIVVAVSAGLGAGPVLLRWLGETVYWWIDAWRWDLNGHESLKPGAEVLRKALRSPGAPDDTRLFPKVSLKVGAETWQGILLRRTARQVTIATPLDVTEKDNGSGKAAGVITSDGAITDREKLEELVKSGDLVPAAAEWMKRTKPDGTVESVPDRYLYIHRGSLANDNVIHQGSGPYMKFKPQ